MTAGARDVQGLHGLREVLLIQIEVKRFGVLNHANSTLIEGTNLPGLPAVQLPSRLEVGVFVIPTDQEVVHVHYDQSR